jgi:F-type H+-transporting ATPase subunit gamma
VKTYGEIASIKMMRTREAVLYARNFLEQIAEVFDEVRASHLEQVMKLAKKKKISSGERVTTLSHNGKTVAVLLSANTRLYGDLVMRTYNEFLEEARSNEVEVTIVGKVGMALFREHEPTHPATYFDYPDDGKDETAMEEIVKHLVQYEEIHVYYGKFKNVVRQEPDKYVMTAGLPLSDAGKQSNKPREYLFEPSLQAILKYFEKEIFGTMLSQTVDESQLGKYASRLVAMDRAEQNIDKRLKKMEVEQLRARHATQNRKQLNLMSAVLARF